MKNFLTLITQLLIFIALASSFSCAGGAKQQPAQPTPSQNTQKAFIPDKTIEPDKASEEKSVQPEVSPTPTVTKTAVVISENANLRQTPNSAGEVIVIIPEGTSVEVIKQRKAWFLVRSKGNEGWVHGNTIRLTGSNSADHSSDPGTPVVESKSAAGPSYGRDYITGPQGGCYYINSSGNKTYVDRSFCGGDSNPPNSSGYIRGPRGGCYFINSRGNKTYVDRSLCN